jgi:TP901 family phage tail tape measure protein
MPDSESRIVFSADAAGIKKAIESQLKDLSFNLSQRSFTQVRTEMEKVLKNKFTVEIELKGNSGQLKAFGDITNKIADQFDKIGKAKDRLASNFAEKFPKMIGQVQRLSTALSDVATQFKNVGGSVPNTRQSKISVGTTGTSGKAAAGTSSETKQLSSEVDKLTKANLALQNSLDKSESKLKKQSERLRDARNATLGFSEQTGATARRLAAYLLPAAGIFQIARGLGAAKDQLVEVNKAVIQLTQVLNGNVEQANSLASDTLKIAKSMGQSGTELLKISNFLAQSGDKFSSTSGTLQEALKAIAASNLGATFGNLEETVQGGLAYLNQFNKSGNELIDILDVANKLSKDFAVESKDLFTAVQTGGAAFAALGGDFKDFQAVVTAIRSLTRLSASSIGTGLNSVVLNVFNSDNLQFIREMGINVNDTNGKLKSFVEIMRAVAQKFKEVNQESQANIADKLFGKRQAKIGIALLRDLGDPASLTEKALKDADKASGSLFRDAQLGLSRIDVQFQSVLATFQELIKDIATDKGFQNFIHDIADGLKTVLELLKGLNNAGGLLSGGGLFPTLLKAGGGLLAGKLLFGGGIKEFAKGFTNKTGDTRNPGGLSAVTTGSLDDDRINSFFSNPFRRRRTSTTSTIAGAPSSEVFGPPKPTDRTDLNTFASRQQSLQRQIFNTQQKIVNAQKDLADQNTVKRLLREDAVNKNLARNPQLVDRALALPFKDSSGNLRPGIDLEKVIREKFGAGPHPINPTNFFSNFIPPDRQQDIVKSIIAQRGGKLSIQDLRSIATPSEKFRAEDQATRQEKAAFAEQIFQRRQALTTLGPKQQGPVLPADQANKIILKEINVERNRTVQLIQKEIQLQKELNEVTAASQKATLGSVAGGAAFGAGRAFGKFRKTLGKVPAGQIGAFAAPIILDLIGQNLFQQRQDLFGTDFDNNIAKISPESIARRRSENTQAGSARGFFGGASVGASVGLVGGAPGVAAGAAIGGIIGVVNGYSDAIKDNRESLLLATSASKGLSDVSKDISNAFDGFTPKIGLVRFATLQWGATLEDVTNELNNGTPASEAARQSLRKATAEIVKTNRGTGKPLSGSIQEIAAKINASTDDGQLAQAQILYAVKYAKELDKQLNVQKEVTIAIHNFNDSLKDFLSTLNKSVEDLDFKLAQSGTNRGIRGTFLEATKNASSFSAGSFGSIIGGAAQQKFNFLAGRGQVNAGNINQLSLGQFTPQEANQATFFSGLSQNIEKSFNDISKVLETFDTADQGGATTELQNIIANFKAATSGLATNPAQAKTINSIVDLLQTQLKPENAAKFDQKTADEIRNKALESLNPLPKLGELLAKRLAELGDSVLDVNESFKAQLDVLNQVQEAQRGQVSNRLAQTERGFALGASTDQQLAGLGGVLSQVGSTNVAGAASRLNQARLNFASQSANATSFLTNGGGVGNFFAALQTSAEKLNTAQNQYNNTVQNAAIATGILTKQFSVLQQKLGETIQTLSNRGRSTFGELVEARIGLGQAAGFGVTSGLKGISSIGDLAGKSPQDLASLGARFAQIPDSIADRIRKSFSLEGSSKLFPGGPSGNDAAQIFDIIRGIGRSTNPQQAAADLAKSMSDLAKKSDELKRLEDAQNQALFSIALNTEQIARHILGGNFKVNIDLQKLIGGTGALNNTGTTPIGGPPGGSNVPTNSLDRFSNNAFNAATKINEVVQGIPVAGGKNLEEVQSLSSLSQSLSKLTVAIEEAKKTGSNVQFSGDFNVFGLGDVAKDQATAAIVIKVMETFRDQLDSSDAAQAKLRDNLNAALKTLQSGNK